MFIVFEGIDGSGKTTISNKVANRLRKSGLSVTHVREDGTFTSSSAQAIRELGRDARNLMLSPLSELLLYLARDAQSLEEVVLPALPHSDIVISDRYLYSAQLLAIAGRGIAPEIVRSIAAPFEARLSPDLAILVDVPPDVARARRRVSKLISPSDKPGSRKNLAGGGLQVKMHRAHRELADQNPDVWLVVENDDADLSEVVDALTAAIYTAHAQGVAAGLAEGRRRLPRPAAPLPAPSTPAEAREALLAWIDHRAVREPALAAYILGGCSHPDIHVRRRALAEHAPVVVAHGLVGLDDLEAWRLRQELAEQAPHAVAKSLNGLATPEAYRWRRALATVVPEAVASSLNGLDDPDAWFLRDTLRELCADAVCASLTNVQSARADTERRRWLATCPAEGPTTYGAARAGARMVNGCTDDVAWRIRQLTFGLAPADTIASLKGDDSSRAWRWREKYLDRAPRPVADSIGGMDAPEAWALRAALAPHCREAFQSMIGLDGVQAWALRTAHADVWPSTVCKSLGALAHTSLGTQLLTEILRNHRGVSLLRNAARLDQLPAQPVVLARPPMVRMRAELVS
ncbi:MAG TPA: dTMP kinase [Kofleriaceae bacterium]|nr:dTMP kinase [Kofleriaceae bacterium]